MPRKVIDRQTDPFPPLTSRERDAMMIAGHVLAVRADRMHRVADALPCSRFDSAEWQVAEDLEHAAAMCRDLHDWILGRIVEFTKYRERQAAAEAKA